VNSAFLKLPEEKREAIISVCIEEFANNGYDNTSTDTITSRLGISKGILFHYFKSKKNLYHYIIDYVINYLSEKTMEEFNKINTQDFFEKMKELAIAKQRLMITYPKEAKIIIDVMYHAPSSIKKEMEAIREKTSKNSYNIRLALMKDMIPPKLRKGVTIEKAMEITQGLFEQLTKKYQVIITTKSVDLNTVMDKMVEELDQYIEIIKHGIYG